MAHSQKQQRISKTRPDEDTIIEAASKIFKRQQFLLEKRPRKKRSKTEENYDMHEFFGANSLDLLALWNLMSNKDLLPEGGTIDHLLWTFLWLKCYGKRKMLCSLCGGIDGPISKDTLIKWVVLFLDAIANCEPYVVSFVFKVAPSYPVLLALTILISMLVTDHLEQ